MPCQFFPVSILYMPVMAVVAPRPASNTAPDVRMTRLKVVGLCWAFDIA
jgi:hypothetical protein